MADSIHKFLSSRDPQMIFRWRVTGSQSAFGIDPRYVERITIPWANFESMPVYVQGSNKYYHSVNDHEPISITFYVDKDLVVVNAIQKWVEKVYSKGRYGIPKDYKKTFGADILNNNSDSVSAAFKIEGAWPSSVDALEFSNENERMMLTVTLTVDQVYYMNAGESGAQGPPSPNSALYENTSRGNPNTGSGISKGFTES